MSTIGLDSFPQRAIRALGRKVVLFIRQSTPDQKRDNPGSEQVQRLQLEHVERLGVKPENILVIDARGESGRGEIVREKFEQLVQLVESGVIGMVILARYDRLGRNDTDSARLYNLLAKQRALVMVDGRIYDPAEPSDDLILGLQSKFAEYENRARTRWMVLTRMALARMLKAPVNLPLGLVWASPEDTVYVQRLREAGLLEWIADLSGHRAFHQRHYQTRYVLPDPDRALFQSVVLRLRWILEEESLRGVIRRIETDPDWPVPGMVPRKPGFSFNPEQMAEWVPVNRSILEIWYRSPALYGIYAFRSRVLEDQEEGGAGGTYTVWETNAFPSFAGAVDYPRVRRILSSGARVFGVRYPGPRLHPLPSIRCAHVTSRGTMCGSKLTACYQADGTYRYASSWCKGRGHTDASIGPELDDLVIRIVLSVFRGDALRRAMDSLRAHGGGILSRRTEVESRVARLQMRVQGAVDRELDARAADNVEDQSFWMGERERYRIDLVRAERELAELVREEGRARALRDTELEKLVALASDLPRLLERARGIDGKARAILADLITEIYVRRVTRYVMDVEVEFPTGARVPGRVFTRGMTSTQPQRLYAAMRLAAGASQDEVAKEMNDALAAVWERAPHRLRFDADRVQTAALLNENSEPVQPREGTPQGVRELAVRMDCHPTRVLEAVLEGALGPAAWTTDGLTVVPKERELDRAFPEYARGKIAGQRGWAVLDILPLAEVVTVKGAERQRVQRLARQTNSLVRDDSGRVWVHRKGIEAGALQRCVQAALERLHPELAVEYWVPMREARRILGGATEKQIRLRAITATPGSGHQGALSRFVWLSPAEVERLGTKRITEVVAAMGENVQMEDFLTVNATYEWMRARFACGTLSMLSDALRYGRVFRVRARPATGGALRLFVRIPRVLQESTDPALLRAWLAGTLESESAREPIDGCQAEQGGRSG
ncbi:MAG: recombinase family protein [Longimicrobiaceae bacterium]